MSSLGRFKLSFVSIVGRVVKSESRNRLGRYWERDFIIASSLVLKLWELHAYLIIISWSWAISSYSVILTSLNCRSCASISLRCIPFLRLSFCNYSSVKKSSLTNSLICFLNCFRCFIADMGCDVGSFIVLARSLFSFSLARCLKLFSTCLHCSLIS